MSYAAPVMLLPSREAASSLGIMHIRIHLAVCISASHACVRVRRGSGRLLPIDLCIPVCLLTCAFPYAVGLCRVHSLVAVGGHSAYACPHQAGCGPFTAY